MTLGADAAASSMVAQTAIRAQLMRDVIRLWPMLDQSNVTGTYRPWLAAMVALLQRYHMQSSTAAGMFYRRARAAATESPAPASLIVLAPPPPVEWITKAVGFAGPGMLNRDMARPKTALSTTLGTSSRIALAGGRTTVLNTTLRDPVAVGWYRVTDGQPCAFCALLASRGVVAKDQRGQFYRSEESASFKAHNDCGCTAAPAFSRNQELPETSQRAAQVYRNRGKGPALQAFRKAWAEASAK